MNDQYQQEHENPMGRDEFHEKPLENPTGQEAGSPIVKTEIRNPAVPAPAGQVGGNAEYPEMLLDREEAQHFRTRWKEIQSRFVDEPRSSVQEADALVTELMDHITQTIANERRTLEGHWNQGDVDTENLRQILMSYRSFFNRLLI